MLMRYQLTFLLPLFFCVPSADAFEAVLETVPVQYEVITVQNPEVEQLILGELEGEPEMFEIVSDTPFTLTAEIRAIPDTVAGSAPQLSGIVIRQKEIRGVEEIARLNAEESAWAVMIDPSTGLKYQAGPYFSEQVQAGTYRIEISSPDNYSQYLLLLGNQKDTNGYFASLADTKLVYQFYGLSSIKMVSSPYVHYPLGILLLLVLITGTWYWHRNQKHHA